MAELTREEIISAVQDALKNHPCRFDVTSKEVDHLVGMVIDIGAAATGEADGSFRAGVEQLRKAHLWLIDRMELDEEYTANHSMWSKVRCVLGGFADKLAHILLWALVGLLIFSLFVMGAVKLGAVKVGG